MGLSEHYQRGNNGLFITQPAYLVDAGCGSVMITVVALTGNDNVVPLKKFLKSPVDTWIFPIWNT